LSNSRVGIHVLPERGSKRVRPGEGSTKPVGKRSTLLTVGVLGVAARPVGLLIGLFRCQPRSKRSHRTAGGATRAGANGGRQARGSLCLGGAQRHRRLGSRGLQFLGAQCPLERGWRWSLDDEHVPATRPLRVRIRIDGRWWGQDPLADEYVCSFGEECSSVRYVAGSNGT